MKNGRPDPWLGCRDRDALDFQNIADRVVAVFGHAALGIRPLHQTPERVVLVGIGRGKCRHRVERETAEYEKPT